MDILINIVFFLMDMECFICIMLMVMLFGIFFFCWVDYIIIFGYEINGNLGMFGIFFVFFYLYFLESSYMLLFGF